MNKYFLKYAAMVLVCGYTFPLMSAQLLSPLTEEEKLKCVKVEQRGQERFLVISITEIERLIITLWAQYETLILMGIKQSNNAFERDIQQLDSFSEEIKKVLLSYSNILEKNTALELQKESLEYFIKIFKKTALNTLAKTEAYSSPEGQEKIKELVAKIDNSFEQIRQSLEHPVITPSLAVKQLPEQTAGPVSK